jgi:Transposase DDE domain
LGGEAEVGGVNLTADREASMDADLDTLLTAVYCTADDLLPERPGNARRRVTDAEVVTLCVAQAIMGIPSDRRFLAVADKRLRELFPELPKQPGFHKRRGRLRDTIEWLIGVFAADSPGAYDDLVLLDSTPVECGRSLETARRSELADFCGYGYCRSHSRFFWGMRLHLCAAADGTPRAAALVAADRPEREVALSLLPQALRGGEALVTDKGYAGREFELAVEGMDAQHLRPARKDEPDNGLHLSSIRQRIESIFWTCKDLLTLERHGARTIEGLTVRIATRLLTLAACIALNHRLGRPSRSLVAYVA